MWNLLCQYNNIYAGSYKYLKEKKSTKGRLKKKKKKLCNCWTNQNGTVALATVQSLGKKNGSLHQMGHIVIRKKSTNG